MVHVVQHQEKENDSDGVRDVAPAKKPRLHQKNRRPEIFSGEVFMLIAVFFFEGGGVRVAGSVRVHENAPSVGGTVTIVL